MWVWARKKTDKITYRFAATWLFTKRHTTSLDPRDCRYDAPMTSWPTRPTFPVLSRTCMRASLVDSSGKIWPMSCNKAAISNSSRASRRKLVTVRDCRNNTNSLYGPDEPPADSVLTGWSTPRCSHLGHTFLERRSRPLHFLRVIAFPNWCGLYNCWWYSFLVLHPRYVPRARDRGCQVQSILGREWLWYKFVWRSFGCQCPRFNLTTLTIRQNIESWEITPNSGLL